jgi:hypothetical protein
MGATREMSPESDAARPDLRHSDWVTNAWRAWPWGARGMRVALVLVGLAALAVYVLPGLLAPAANWPLWDVRVYWWGGRQAAAGGGVLYVPGAPLGFTYPPFAAEPARARRTQ